MVDAGSVEPRIPIGASDRRWLLKRSGRSDRATQQRTLAVLAEMFAGQRKGHNATRHVCYNVALSQCGDCLAVEVVVVLHTSRKQRQRQWTAFL
jgi:hypothetical protein